ncbi:hypothetical protein GGH91_001319 [Coemansia sp. RSA 2671]|nr:hypothetical protein LPJ60_002202 [Coemansia sp. RSA 2675]KAJ2348551.1 hypothetical protein GGH91_001319 [Coemansia sp. RSA 2671]
MSLNAVSADSYPTRDKLVVLSMAAVLGAKDWDKIARVLNSSFPPLLPGGAREYTRSDCLSIYQDAVNRAFNSGCSGSESAMLYESLCSLKCRRLDEIQERLEHIALAIEETETRVDGTEIILGSSGAPGGVSHRAMSPPGVDEPLGIISQEAYVSRHEDRIGGAAMGEEVATEPRSELPEETKYLVVGGEAECDAEASLVTPQKGTISEHAEDAHPKLSAASEPQTPAATSPNISDDGVAEEATALTSPSPSPPIGELEQLTAESDSAQMAAPADSYGGKASAPSPDEQQMRNWKKNINTVWRDISGHRLGSMFVSPIKSADAPNYYEVIRQPLDLKTIKNRIRDEDITTTIEFYRDVMHMLMNAIMYNAEDTEVYQMTMEIIPDAQACIEQLLQAEAAVNQPQTPGNHHEGVEAALSTLAAPLAAASAASGGDDGSRADETQQQHPLLEADDSDSSVPAKRRRRVASERASKHLRS